MNRTLNVTLFVIFLALTARGVYVLATTSAPKNTVQDAAQTTSYILLAIFAALTLVFGWRLLKRK